MYPPLEIKKMLTCALFNDDVGIRDYGVWNNTTINWTGRDMAGGESGLIWDSNLAFV